ncbi:MAG: carbohydrate-binding family 9-like protein [Acutalibacteraceae bacterium]|nr:carbohydrate-binding family 9-like protein [Acutalibacteraceae bacterium]
MKHYLIQKFNGWQNVPVINIDTPYGEKAKGIFAYGQVAYKKQEILVHLRAVEKDIRSEETDILGAPCKDSCLEFFFCPNSDELRYFNIEINLAGCVFLGFGSSVDNLVRLVVDFKELFDLKINKTEDGWEVFYKIPCEFINRFFPEFKLESGKKIKANLYKCGELCVQEHYLSWCPVVEQVSAFHNPSMFGLMYFE